MTLTDTLQPVLEKKFPAALVVASLLLATSALAASPRDTPVPAPAAVAPSAAGYPFGAPSDALAPDTAAEIDGVLHSRDPAMRAMFARDMRVAMLGEPASGSTWAVGIRQANGATQIVYAKWVPTAVTRDGHVTAHRADTCQTAIDAGLAERVEDVWRAMIAAARVDTSGMLGLDGDSYLFVLPSSGKGGHTWEPGSGTKPGALVDIGFAMARYCATRERWLLPAAWYYAFTLDRDVTRLHARLEVEGKKK